ncbi:MAG TPA: hypothetical protein VHC22_16335 [Pirellulales bacterium]|nr:hypothetical protein [Pirellulales bacterium]
MATHRVRQPTFAFPIFFRFGVVITKPRSTAKQRLAKALEIAQ